MAGLSSALSYTRAMRKLVLCLLLVPALLTAEEVADSRRLQQEALRAYRGKDYPLFLAKMRAASDLRPSHPTLLYNVASGLALNGRAVDALSTLERVAAMGLVYAPEKDADFESLRSSSRFAAVVDSFKRNAAASGSGKSAFVLPERGIIAEGLAYHSKSKRFFVSSVRNGTISTVDSRGNVATFVRDLPRGAFGMAVDQKRGVLWATTSTLRQNARFREDDRDRAAVVEIDLRSGRILRTIAAPEGGKHLFGDVIVGNDGEVYVSDSIAPAIYRVKDGALETFIAGAPFLSLQGLALAPGGKTLYASDYSKGIAAIDLTTRDIHFLRTPSEATLLGIDGLYFAGGNNMIATQNGVNPQRVIRIRLAAGGLGVDGTDILSANQTGDITLGAIANGSFYFNADAGWNEYDDDGKVKDETKLKPSVVYRVPLDFRK